MTRPAELLGEVTLPSGTLVIIDCGLLGMWSHDRPPRLPPGVLDRGTTAAVNLGADLEIVGPDAEQAGLTCNRQARSRFIYDVPQPRIAEVVADFNDHFTQAGIEATLSPLEARVPHRARVDQATELGAGAGQLSFFGQGGGVVTGLPTDRVLPLYGVCMQADAFAGCWEHVELRLREPPAAPRVETVAHVSVEYARVLFADADALGAWRHDEPSDGLADCVFWGLHAKEVAELVGAPALGDQFGWTDLPVERAAERALEVERTRDARGWRLPCDFRPHSDHYRLLAQLRATETDSGTLDVGGARVCGLMTTWGDGVFPVQRVFDGDELAAVRIELGTDHAQEALRAVNSG